ncbi:MAG: DNA topoisomerase IB [Rhodanobacteraceae bacterium]
MKPESTAAALRYSSDTEPGITRRRAGRGFSYSSPTGRRVHDQKVLARIRALAIPPAYRDVWICRDPSGHLQATGRDARGRKQYRYHPGWRAWRDTEKYRRLVRFGKALPTLRRRLRKDLARQSLPRVKVLAVVVSLLMETRIRIGNGEYADSNHSYGLTTLRSRHAAFLRNGRARFHFRGKSGQEREVVLDDRRLARLVRACQRLPGQMLFQYVDDEDNRRPVDSTQVNAYIREAIGDGFSAKDFRTWVGTLTAVALLAQTPLPENGDERAQRSTIAGVVKSVAAELGNTAAVCRKAYICPAVFESWRSGELHRLVSAAVVKHPRQLEKRALRMLGRCSSTAVNS